MTKLERIKVSLNHIEYGGYSEFTLSQCCDYINWTAKFKKAPPEIWQPLCEKATELLKRGYY